MRKLRPLWGSWVGQILLVINSYGHMRNRGSILLSRVNIGFIDAPLAGVVMAPHHLLPLILWCGNLSEKLIVLLRFEIFFSVLWGIAWQQVRAFLKGKPLFHLHVDFAALVCGVCGTCLLLCPWVTLVWFGSSLNIQICKNKITTLNGWFHDILFQGGLDKVDKARIASSLDFTCWNIGKSYCKAVMEGCIPSSKATVTASSSAISDFFLRQKLTLWQLEGCPSHPSRELILDAPLLPRK